MDILSTLRKDASNRHVLLHLWWNATYSRFWCQSIDLSRVKRLIFVCAGNVCRSPYAAARARQLELDSLSFGLYVEETRAPPEIAVETAWQRGVDLTPHRSQPLDADQVQPNDLVLVMEPGMLIPTKRRVEGSGGTVALLGAIHGKDRAGTPYIPDPYGLPETVFSLVFAIIDDAVEALGAHLRKKR